MWKTIKTTLAALNAILYFIKDTLVISKINTLTLIITSSLGSVIFTDLMVIHPQAFERLTPLSLPLPSVFQSILTSGMWT